MPLIVYGIGFAVCYFLFDLSWWMSLLIAFAAPVILGLVTWLIGAPIMGMAALIEKIKGRGERLRPEVEQDKTEEDKVESERVYRE